MKNISTRLDQFSATCNNLILIWDFNFDFNFCIKKTYNNKSVALVLWHENSAKPSWKGLTYLLLMKKLQKYSIFL